MGTENSVLRKQALEAISGNWGIAIAGFLIFTVLLGAGGGTGLTIILGGPLYLGAAYFALAFVRKEKVEFELLFKGFNNFGNSLFAYLLTVIFTMLWLLLFIIPGIIKGISYSMTFFIMADNPDIKAMDAIDKSMAMMNGYKMKYFLLSLLFGILILLSGLLLFIPLLWLMPYIYISYAEFYEDIKGKAILIEE